MAHYQNDKFQKEFTIQNNENGYNFLLKYLNQMDSLQIVFESTGIYSRSMKKFCRLHQFDYFELNPLEAKFKTSSLRSWKTDKSDAHKLARMVHDLPATESPQAYEEIYFELRERVRFHLQMKASKTSSKLELSSSCTRHFLVWKNCSATVIQ